MSSVIIDYSPNDFFYIKANNIMPSDASCNDTYFLIYDTSCNISTDSTSKWVTDFSMNCYKKELCKNKINANKLNTLQNNHLGSDQNYINTKDIYMNEYVKSVNLIVGILVTSFLIYKFYK